MVSRARNHMSTARRRSAAAPFWPPRDDSGYAALKVGDPPEFDWDDLLFHVKRGDVIPIVGRDLVTVGGVPFEQKLAERFAEETDLTDLPPPPLSLADVAFRYLRGGRGSVAKL